MGMGCERKQEQEQRGSEREWALNTSGNGTVKGAAGADGWISSYFREGEICLLMLVVNQELIPLPGPNLEHGVDIQAGWERERESNEDTSAWGTGK